MSKADEALKYLVDNGFAELNELGWHFIRRAPTQKELAHFVAAIKTLGAYSVSFNDRPAYIETSRGSQPGEIIFRKRT